jgi:hypothetical protein
MTDKLAPPGVVCLCVKRHAPNPGADLNLHHIQPLSWQGPDIESNRIWICPTTHARAHSVLNEYVRALPGRPDPKVLARYPMYARRLAERAIVAVEGKIPHIYTTHAPGGRHDA